MKKILIMASLGAFLVLNACNDKKNNTGEENAKDSKPLVLVPAPDFNADSAYFFVAKQVSFGTRVPNTVPHIKCKDWMLATLKNFGCEVIEQKFTAKSYSSIDYQLTNVIASINPKAEKRILLAAHWDSRHLADQDSVDKNTPIDGANDAGSGVAVLMEIARIVNQSKTKPTVGIDILLLDGEDQGEPESVAVRNKPDEGASWWCLGSQYWAKNKHVPNYNAYFGILLDMVGNKNAQFYREGMSMRSAPSIVNTVWNTANTLGYKQFVMADAEEIIDDHVFIIRDAKIPMIDIIEYDNSDNAYFSNTWHTHQDNLKNIDKASLKAVGQTVLTIIYQP